jgi:hypothetical protein
MADRLLTRTLVVAAAMLSLALSPTRSFSAVCSPPGEIVVTDPSGDAPTPEIDILDVAIQEVIAGLYTGKFIVTMHVSSLGSTPSGLLIVRWEDATGNNVTQLSMNACEGVAGFGYSYDTPETSDSGAPDGGSYDPSGKIEWIISRDKIGSPTDGETFEQITAVTIRMEPATPLPGCLPLPAGSDGATPGHYVVGNCLVDAPSGRAPVALRLGAPAPNPARRDVSLALDVPAELAGQPYEVAMIDLAGRRLRTLVSGGAVPGRTLLQWDLRDARGERVRPGTYWARITLGGERRAQPVFVVR